MNSINDAQCLLRFLSQSQRKPTFSSANSYLATPNALKVGTAATRLRSGMLVEGINIAPLEENSELLFFLEVGADAHLEWSRFIALVTSILSEYSHIH